MSAKTLILSLNKAPFDVMLTGEKQEEFRKSSDWIRSRLFNRDGSEKSFDLIKFTNGYGADKPYFICKFEGFLECYMNCEARRYSNGLEVSGIGPGDFIIYCGEIIEAGNIRGIKKRIIA